MNRIQIDKKLIQDLMNSEGKSKIIHFFFQILCSKLHNKKSQNWLCDANKNLIRKKSPTYLQKKISSYIYLMKYPTILILGLLLLACSSKLIFSDDFLTFNMSKWKHDITLAGGGNWEFQMYENNRSTSWVNNSLLNIRPILTEDKIGQDKVRNGYDYNIWGMSQADQCTANMFYGCQRVSNGNNYINPVMSAKITTTESFKFKYGRVEVKAKLPKGDWLWPAIWLLPRHNEYGNWPASGEIDIMESRGNVGYPASAGGGPQSFGSTLHWGPDWTANQFNKTHAVYTKPSGTLADEFHIYGLYWDNKTLYTYIDNDTNKVLQVNHSAESYWDKSGITNRENPWRFSNEKNAPFNTEFYLIINLAVGGTAGYFPDGVNAKPWSDHSQRASSEFYDNKGAWFNTWGPQSIFQIDSVNVWDLAGKTEAEEVKPVNLLNRQVQEE